MYYVLVLVLLFLVELFYFKVADKCNIIDKPNKRSSHTRITLRGGGIIFYFGALAYFLTNHWEYSWFILALSLITFISFVDDIRSTSQGLRLVFHFSAMALMHHQPDSWCPSAMWGYHIIGDDGVGVKAELCAVLGCAPPPRNNLIQIPHSTRGGDLSHNVHKAGGCAVTQGH